MNKLLLLMILTLIPLESFSHGDQPDIPSDFNAGVTDCIDTVRSSITRLDREDHLIGHNHLAEFSAETSYFIDNIPVFDPVHFHDLEDFTFYTWTCENCATERLNPDTAEEVLFISYQEGQDQVLFEGGTLRFQTKQVAANTIKIKLKTIVVCKATGDPYTYNTELLEMVDDDLNFVETDHDDHSHDEHSHDDPDSAEHNHNDPTQDHSGDVHEDHQHEDEHGDHQHKDDVENTPLSSSPNSSNQNCPSGTVSHPTLNGYCLFLNVKDDAAIDSSLNTNSPQNSNSEGGCALSLARIKANSRGRLLFFILMSGLILIPRLLKRESRNSLESKS